MVKLLVMAGSATLLAVSGCAQAPVASQPAGRAAPAAAIPAQAPATAPPATPVPPTPTPPPPTPVPTPAPTPVPTPPPPAISLGFGPGTVTVSVSGITSGAHQVHIHRDCTGNPNLHIVTLGDVFVNSDGTGSRTFSVSASLRNRGFDLLVYPLGASQGPPTLCSGV